MSGPDPRGDQQLLKDAIQASDLNLTDGGQRQFALQFRRILKASTAVFLATNSKEPARRIDGATAALQLKSRQLDVVAQAVADLRMKDDAESRTLLDNLYNLASVRSKLSFDEAAEGEQVVRTKRLRELERSRDRLQAKLLGAGGKSNDEKDASVTLAAVQEHLGEGDVLIEWARVMPFDPAYLLNKGSGRAWGDPRYFAFMIVRDQPPEVFDLGPANVIEAAIVKLLAQLKNPAPAFDPVASRALFDLVIKPWIVPLAGLGKRVDQMLLAPDGALNAIPMAALIDEEGRYFGERHTLNFLTSGRDLLRLQSTPTATERQERIVVIAAPDYTTTDNEADASRKLAAKRMSRDIADAMMIAREKEGPDPELNQGQASAVERLKQLSEDKKAGKPVDPAEVKRLGSELQAPVISGIFSALFSKAKKLEKLLDRQDAEVDAAAKDEAVADRRARLAEGLEKPQNARGTARSRKDSFDETQVPGAANGQGPGTTVNGSNGAQLRKRQVFKPLPGALAEGELLRQITGLNAAQIFSGTEATEGLVKKLHRPRVLHIATHGFFLPPADETPTKATVTADRTRGQVEYDESETIKLGVQRNPMLRSGIALAGANRATSDSEEDGILTAEELAQLDLQGTELVVLSACETGTGDVANGEGIFGLRRALMLAGARSQLVSLWRIGDQETPVLMGEYYRRLKSGMGRAKSLQLAQEKLRRDASTSHPYYWAAFVSVGDWRPIAGF